MINALASSRIAIGQAALRRRMCRILVAMIEGGRIEAEDDGQLVTDSGRWYVGPTAVDPIAARRLLQLGMLRHVSVNHSQSYELPDSTRQRITHLQRVSPEREMTIEAVSTVLIDEASARSALRYERFCS